MAAPKVGKTVCTVLANPFRPHYPTQVGSLNRAIGKTYIKWAIQGSNL